jgi:hypothetical protein
MCLSRASGRDEGICEAVVCAKGVVDSWCTRGALVGEGGGRGGFGGDDAEGLEGRLEIVQRIWLERLVRLNMYVEGVWLTMFAMELASGDGDECGWDLINEEM